MAEFGAVGEGADQSSAIPSTASSVPAATIPGHVSALLRRAAELNAEILNAIMEHPPRNPEVLCAQRDGLIDRIAGLYYEERQHFIGRGGGPYTREDAHHDARADAAKLSVTFL